MQGATGNVSTEDVVYMLQGLNIETVGFVLPSPTACIALSSQKLNATRKQKLPCVFAGGGPPGSCAGGHVHLRLTGQTCQLTGGQRAHSQGGAARSQGGSHSRQASSASLRKDAAAHNRRPRTFPLS